MSPKDPAGGGESPFSLEALHSPGRAVEEPREWGRLHQVARALSPRAQRHLERALVQDALDRGRRDRRGLARGVLSLRRAADGRGAGHREAWGERELDVAEAQVVAPLFETQGHAGVDDESPFLDRESPFLDRESPFLDHESPFLDAEAAASSPFDGLSASEMKALYVTSTFETGRAGSFGGLTGNFDGQGLSFGLMNFAWKAGSLTSLLATFIKDHPAAFASAFGPDAARFKEVVLATRPDPKNPQVRARDVGRQMKFAVEVMNNANKKVQEPWVTYFGRLERDPDFRRLQAKGAREAAKRARHWYDYFGLKTERGFAFMFDLVSSHGGAWLNAPKFKGKRRTLLRAMLEKKKADVGRAELTELEKLEVIANMIADVSLARWQHDARTRKLWFVNGSGKVHGTFWHLANDFGVTDAPPNFDPTSGGLAKPPPAPVKARAKSKKKAPDKAAPKSPAAKAPSPFDWSRYMFGFGPSRAMASQELDDEGEPYDNERAGTYPGLDGEGGDEGELDGEAEAEADADADADNESAWADREGPDDEAYGDDDQELDGETGDDQELDGETGDDQELDGEAGDEQELDDEAYGDDESELDDEAGDGVYAEPEVDDEYGSDDEAGDEHESTDDEAPPGGLDGEAVEGGLSAHEMFAIDEELEREATTPWAEGEAPGDLLPADSVDEAAAELPFAAALRNPSSPLLSPAKAAAAVKWNAQRHPSASGITVEALGRRLDAYIDRPKLAEALRRANAAGASYPDDTPTLVALAAHQFQRRVFASAKAHDGMAGEGTLDGLGFVRHRGKKLNIDRTNATAKQHLRAVQKKDPAAFSSLGPDVTAGTWFQLIVNAPFLGQTFTNGIHVELLRRLRRAQAHLMTLPRYRGMSPAELGRALHVNEAHKGARPANTNKSMHTFGLAVDISYWQNPWVAGSNFLKAESRQRFVEASGRSTLLVEGKAAPLTAARLSSWGNERGLGTAEVYDRIKQRSEAFQTYLRLGEDSAALRAHLQAKKAAGAAGIFQPGESVDQAVARWTAQIKADLAGVQATFGRRRPRDGFLNLPRDLVVALRDHGCLAWGGVDLGAGESGDMMHFDCRAQGVGYAIAPAKTVGAGHPCYTAAAGERELAFEGEVARPPVWVKRASARGQLFRYKSAAAGGTTAVFVPSSLPAGAPVKVLVYLHGLRVCGGEGGDAVSYVKSELFPLVDIVEQSGRGVVLVVPSMRWQKGQTSHRLGQPAAMNALVDEVRRGLTQAGWADPPEVEGLYLAGHSKAFVVLDALGRRSNLAASGEGALAKLRQVWSLDTMYGVGSGACKVWLEWALRRSGVSFSVHYRPGSPTATVSECLLAAVRARTTGASPKRGCNCDSASAGAPSNLAVYPEKVSHCGIVKALFGKKLAAIP